MENEATTAGKKEKPPLAADAVANLSICGAVLGLVLLGVSFIGQLDHDNPLTGLASLASFGSRVVGLLATLVSIVLASMAILRSSSATNPLLVQIKALFGILLASLPVLSVCAYLAWFLWEFGLTD